ncbi:unnamed protein product [Heterosigma akashiwo]
MGLHTSEIVEGYRRAYEHCKEVMPSLKVETVTDVRDEAALVRVLRPVIMTKQQGFEELLAPLVARACLTVMPPAPAAPKLNVDHVRIAKLRGGATSASACLRGMVVLRDSENAVKRVADAKVTVFGCGLEASATEAKGTVLIKTAEELLNYNKAPHRSPPSPPCPAPPWGPCSPAFPSPSCGPLPCGEERAMEDAIRAIAESGCRVVAVGGSVSEMALHFLTKYEVMCVKVPSKWELRRLCAAVNATALVRVGAATPDEMGHCDLVEVREVAGRKILVLEQTAAGDTRLATVVLRAATDSVINDLARAVDDAVNAVKTLCRDGALVAGGGAFEAELAKSVAELGERTAGLDQYAVRKFAEALAVVPRTLAETTGMPGTETMARLTAAHARGEAGAGVDIDDSDVADMPSKGVVDLYACKESAIRLAVDAAVTVLRVDQIIMSKQAGGPKAPPGGGPGM